MKSITSRLVLFLMMLMIATTTVHASETEERVNYKGATRISFFGTDAESSLASTLYGDGVDTIEVERPATASAGGVATWVKRNERVDKLGHRHVFYRQHYTSQSGGHLDVASPANAAVPLVGAEIGVHYTPDGKMYFASGAQFDDVVAVSVPLLVQAADVYDSVQEAIQDWPGYSPAEVTLESRQNSISTAQLLLDHAGSGSFRYIWKIQVSDALGMFHIASLDAETGLVLSLLGGPPKSACQPPSSPDEDNAIGISQRGGVRNIWATDATDRGEDYTHEAHKNATASTPDIQIFYRPAEEDDFCDDNDPYKKWALMPIPTVGYWPKYDWMYDENDNQIPGDVAADAMYFTYLAMDTFDDFGYGWPGSEPARVFVHHINDPDESNTVCFGGGHDTSWMNLEEAAGSERYPEYSVIHCQADVEDYCESAALDIVAHEWAHALMYKVDLWSILDDPGGAFQEGWADVVGHAVEWQIQPETSDLDDPDPEEADWHFGEDRGSDYSGRRPDEDDGEGPFAFHSADEAGEGTAVQERYWNGHPLPVAYYLMSDGGTNPWCETDPGNDDCEVDVTGIGTDKAGRIMFFALMYYMTSADGWDDFADIVKAAAWVLYQRCYHPYDYPATLEQAAARDAFQAIGYPATYPQIFQCPP